MKPKAALTISLVRDDISRHTLYSSCSLVVTSMASGGGGTKSNRLSGCRPVINRPLRRDAAEVGGPTFVLVHQPSESQNGAGDHGDGAGESCVHQHQVLVHGICIGGRRLS